MQRPTEPPSLGVRMRLVCRATCSVLPRFARFDLHRCSLHRCRPTAQPSPYLRSRGCAFTNRRYHYGALLGMTPGDPRARKGRCEQSWSATATRHAASSESSRTTGERGGEDGVDAQPSRTRAKRLLGASPRPSEVDQVAPRAGRTTCASPWQPGSRRRPPRGNRARIVHVRMG